MCNCNHVRLQLSSLQEFAMKYKTTAVEVIHLEHDFFRVPGITMATDVICGFPTETWEDFEETVALVEEYKFPSLFINQFYPRPGTPAARMKRLPTEEVPLHTLQHNCVQY